MTPGSDPAALARTYGEEARERVGFFTDTTVCIGCKACEVACKEWNLVPDDGFVWTGESLDNTGRLSADTWRHVAFIEQDRTLRVPAEGGEDSEPLRLLMSSDVCKHCSHAACLEVCPTGALFRTEFGTVVVQDDVCNGCGYCVPACPFGVLDRRERDERRETPGAGGVHKCTLCYDRLGSDMTPACAKACPTESIQFGPLDVLRERATERLASVQQAGFGGARLYGEDPGDGVGGFGAFFLLLDEPEAYGLPPHPIDPTRRLGEMWQSAAKAGALLAVAVAAAAFGGRR
jgi:formate dehydrogenase iron-sulfur subunit